MGNAWTADYLKITGELDVDLRSNIAAEAGAKIVYERLINFFSAAISGTKDALQFPDDPRDHPICGLFSLAPGKHGQNRHSALARSLRPQNWSTNTSTIQPVKVRTAKWTRADRGTRGEPWQYVEVPGVSGSTEDRFGRPGNSRGKFRPVRTGADRRNYSSTSCATFFTPKKQLVKALAEDGQGRPAGVQLQRLLKTHLGETETQVERLNEKPSADGRSG